MGVNQAAATLRSSLGMNFLLWPQHLPTWILLGPECFGQVRKCQDPSFAQCGGVLRAVSAYRLPPRFESVFGWGQRGWPGNLHESPSASRVGFGPEVSLLRVPNVGSD